VQHPNVVAVHDVIEDDDGTPILVMDLLRGESLADKLARQRTLAPADVLTTVRPMLSALAAAHEVGIVHRDLKPDNVFLVDGDASNVRILDFGVAKLTGKDAATKETNRLTETGAMIGTPHYMAPEQAFGESDIDLRADLWSVGAVLYECLSGVTPTNGQNLGQILKVLASGTIRPLASRAPSVPPALAALVDRLLKIDRDERPANAASVLEQLATLAENPDALEAPASPAPTEAVEAIEEKSTFRGVDVTPEPRPRARGRGWMVAAVGAVAVAALAATVGMRRTPQENSVNASAHVASVVPVTTAPPPVVPTEPAPVAPTASASASAAAPTATATAKAPKAVRPAPSAAEAKTKPAASPSGGTPLIAEPTF
jgi:serine/threonine-protein kinase